VVCLTILIFAVLLSRLEKLYCPNKAASIGPPTFETNVDIKA